MVMQNFLIGGGENLRRSESAISMPKAPGAEDEQHILLKSPILSCLAMCRWSMFRTSRGPR